MQQFRPLFCTGSDDSELLLTRVLRRDRRVLLLLFATLAFFGRLNFPRCSGRDSPRHNLWAKQGSGGIPCQRRWQGCRLSQLLWLFQDNSCPPPVVLLNSSLNLNRSPLQLPHITERPQVALKHNRSERTHFIVLAKNPEG